MPNDKLSTMLFREEAIHDINRVNEFDTTIPVAKPSYWLLLVCCIFFTASLIYWIIFYSLSLEIESNGTAINYSQYREAQHEIQNTIQEKNEIALELDKLLVKKSELLAKGYLTKPDLLTAKQAYLAARTELTTTKQQLTSAPSQHITADASYPVVISLINYEDSKKIQPGMVAHLKIKSKQEKKEYWPGKIIYRSPEPISKELVSFYLGSQATTHYYFPSQPSALLLIQPNQAIPLAENYLVRTQYNYCTIWQLLIGEGQCG